MLNKLILLLLFAGLGTVTRAADSDEVKFKAKSYAPHKALQDNAYKGSTFTPSSSQQSVGAPLPAPKKSFWSIFSPSAHAPDDKPLQKAQEAKGDAYKQEKHISVVTIKADPKDAPEHVPFDASGKKVADAPYTAPDKPEGKNPMLKPRQGIKEPQ